MVNPLKPSRGKRCSPGVRERLEQVLEKESRPEAMGRVGEGRYDAACRASCGGEDEDEVEEEE